MAKKETKDYEKVKDTTRMIDGVTECCGYDFGIDGYLNKQIKFCPICGKEIIEKNQRCLYGVSFFV